MAVWQLYGIISIYAKYETTLTIKEGEESPQFPDVTVCNLNVMANARFIDSRLTLSEYLQKLGDTLDGLKTISKTFSKPRPRPKQHAPFPPPKHPTKQKPAGRRI